MRVLVTGAAGFVGSRLSRVLLERGDGVVGFDNLNDYYALEHKQRHLADLRDHGQFTFVEGDLRDYDTVKQAFDAHKPEAVAHLAAMAAVRYSVEHPLIYGSVNVQGSLHLMEAARPAKLPMVLASTGSVYGRNTPVPFVETAAADQPLAPYPASKRAMEMMAHSHHHQYGLRMAVLRFFNVYGPHGRPDMMPWVWSQQIARGEPITLFDTGRLQRDWTYIDDLVGGFVAALDAVARGSIDYEIINLGASCPVENRRFVQILEELLGREARIIDAPTPNSEPLITFADVSKARRLLDYDPRTPVEVGLERFVDWLRAEHLLPTA